MSENEEVKKGFNVDQPITISLKTPEGVKSVAVRFPTDEEWIERQRRRKLVVKPAGRRRTQSQVPDAEEIDAALLETIRTDGGTPEVDQYEAAQIMDQLAEAEVLEVEQDGDVYRVQLGVPGMETVHTVGMPSARELVKYRRKTYHSYDLPHGRQEIIIDLHPAVELYASLKRDVKGYAGAVPCIHQAAVLAAVIEEVEAGVGGTGNENF